MMKSSVVLGILCYSISLFSCSVSDGVDKSNMVMVPAGEFEMGITENDARKIVEANPNFADYEWFADEMPKHKVWLDEFYLDKNEVTNKEFKEFVNQTGYKSEGDWEKYYSDGQDDYPVIGVTWTDANEYCKWVGKRLPTEAEWEKAAKGGNDYLYPWGNEIITGNENCQTEGLKPVGSFPPNKYGIYDLGGNAFEICSDWYDENYYHNSPYKNPQGPEGGQFHVMRGGSWFVNCNFYSRTSRRAHYDQSVQSSKNVVGFRCAYSESESDD
jgi:formylglycine-generating enzyme required for sulfatase activity